nr:MAG: RNA-dependent RNA polymerase [Riboviria sp.]
MALDLAEKWVVDFLLSKLPRKSKFRSIDEHGVDLTGSPGYPYKYIQGIQNKKDWLLKYRYVYDQNLELAKKVGYHFIPYYVWDSFPKFEILDIEKRNKKTRLICGAAPELVFLQDNCMGDLNEMFSQVPLSSKTAIGFNPTLGGWNYLSTLFGDCEIDFSDAKQWDSSMSPSWLLRVYRIRERLGNFSPEEKNVLWFCFSELCNSIVQLSCGDVYFVRGGNKSGSASTCHDNTIGHMLLIAYCFVLLGYNYESFNKHVFCIMGDDLLSQKFPPNFWLCYVTFGVNLVYRGCKTIFDSEFLSYKFLDTVYGVMPYHKNSKMLFSSFSHDTKNWPSIRYQKIFLLYVLNFWHKDKPVYQYLLDLYEIPYDDIQIIKFWSGIL